MKKVAAIVVTFNRKVLLKECIDALIQQNGVDILIIDNASTDGTHEHIHDMIDGGMVLYFNTKKNIGGAGGFNYGIKEAYRRGYEYFWLMDDDTILYSDCYEKLKAANKVLNGDWGFLCSQILWTDVSASLCVMNRQIVHEKWYEDSKLLSQGLLRVKQASFVSTIFKREVVERVGLPIKEFFIWNDDFEYTDRVSKLFKCYIVADSHATHKIGINIEANIEKEDVDRIWRYHYIFRNGFYLARRGGVVKIVKYHLNVLHKLKDVIQSDCNGKFLKCLILIKSLLSGYFFFPQIEDIE